MPKLLERLVSQLKAKGHDDQSAHAIATSTLQRSGSMKHGSTELTAKGVQRQAMGAAGRAKDRAAKYSGRKAADFTYAPKTNRATLKDTRNYRK